MSDRVIIWGCGCIYNRIINQIILLEQLGKITRVAVACKEPLPLSHIDGVKRIHPEEIRNYGFDYVIVAVKEWRSVFWEAEAYGIPEEKLILGTALYTPLFDWDRYIKLKHMRPSIVSDTCWGGGDF